MVSFYYFFHSLYLLARTELFTFNKGTKRLTRESMHASFTALFTSGKVMS